MPALTTTIYITGFAIGGLSLLIFFLGHMGVISPFYVSFATAVFVFSLWFFIKKSLTGRHGREGISPYSGKDKILLASIIIYALAILPLSLTPPSVRDELIHHLAVPKLYIENGRIFQIPFMGFSYFPMNTELLYIIPLLFGADILPRVFHLAFGLMTALTIYAYLRPNLGRGYALAGFFLFLSTPVVTNLSRMAYVDLAGVFFSTLALLGVINFGKNGDNKWLIYSAASMGFSLGIKYNMLIGLFLTTVFVVHLSVKRDGRQMEAVKKGVIYLSVSILFFLPWLLRNYIWTGSPLYPVLGKMAGGVLSGGGAHLGEGIAPVFKRYFLYDEGALQILFLPVRIFLEGRDNSIEKFDGVLNPFLLVFIMLAFLKVKESGNPEGGYRGLKYLAVFSALFFYLVFFTADLVIRYILPILPPLVIIAAYGIKNGLERKGLRPWVIACLVFLFSFNIVYLGGLYKEYRPFLYLSGKETRDDYLLRVLPDYAVTKYANQNIAPQAKVLFLFTGDRGYYWEREYYYSGRTGGNLYGFVRKSGNAEELKEKFSSIGVTHLFIMDALFDRFAMDNFREDEIRLLRDFFKNHAKRLYSANGFSLYWIKQKI